MISVEKFENTLQISKRKHCFVDFTPLKSSRGLSSGNLQVFKTESELCIRPGSPDRYKSVSDSQGLTPSTKISVPKDNFSNSSIEDYFEGKNDQTPIKDLSLFLELDIEEVPDIDTSFFSSENGEKALDIFKACKKDQETFNSFASTNSKTEKIYEEFKKNIKECRNEESKASSNKQRYRNNCKVRCSKCKNDIITDVELRYPRESLFQSIWCTLCISADKTIKGSYFCSICKRFLTLELEDLEYNCISDNLRSFKSPI